MSTRTWKLVATVAFLILLVTGCTSSDPKANPQGVLSMTLKASGGIMGAAPATTGAAADTVGGPTAATIVISGVSARTTDGTWVPVAGTYPQSFDLLALVQSGGGATLPADALPEGSYDALQITIASASITLQDGTVVTITPPSGGWQVLIPVAFSVVAGQETSITLELKCDASFQFVNGEFEFDPDIEVLGVEGGRR